MVGTSQKWPAKAGGRSPKGPAVAGTTVHHMRDSLELHALESFYTELHDLVNALV